MRQGLKPDAERVLAEFGDGVAIPKEALTDQAASAAYLARVRSAPTATQAKLPVAHVSEHAVNSDFAARVYRPEATQPLPLVVYFHGGGWVSGDLDMHDSTCRAIAGGTPCVVVNVAYRLAPEHPFPAPLEDAMAAVRWSASRAHALGGDSERLVVAGSSAGGNLAAAVALRARDEGPRIELQALVYPVLDAAMSTGSYRKFGRGYLVTRDHMAWYWSQYVPDPSRRGDPLASPLRAATLRGLPATLIVTAGCDPLRDEGEAYARRLRESGVTVDCIRFHGQIHGFLAYSLADAHIALEWLTSRLARHFS